MDPNLILKKGEQVILINLKKQEYNNLTGVVENFDQSSNRFIVTVNFHDGQKKRCLFQAKNVLGTMNFCPGSAAEIPLFMTYQNLRAQTKFTYEALLNMIPNLKNYPKTDGIFYAECIRVWYIKLIEYNSPAMFEQVTNVLKFAIPKCRDLKPQVILNKILGEIYVLNDKNEESISILEAHLNQHCGWLPDFASQLLTAYRRTFQFEKAKALYLKMNENVKLGLYVPSSEVPKAYLNYLIILSAKNFYYPNFETLEEFQLVLKQFQIINENHVHSHVYENECGFHQGWLHYYLGNFKISLKFLMKYQTYISRRVGNVDRMGNVFELRALCHIKLNEKQNAKRMLKEAKKFQGRGCHGFALIEKEIEKLENEKKQLKNVKKKTETKCSNPFCEKIEINRKHKKNRFKVCSKCSIATYCSKKCQKHHWKNGHKEKCGK